MNAPRWRGWLVAVAIFLLGLAAGAAGTAWLGGRYLRHALQASPGRIGPADRAAARIGVELTKTLQLTPEESESIQKVLEQSATNLKAVRVQAATQARAELRAATLRLAAALPREKRAEFFRIIAQRYQRLGLPPPSAGADAGE